MSIQGQSLKSVNDHPEDGLATIFQKLEMIPRQSLRSMNDLPEDCLAAIFQKLDVIFDRLAFGLTCRRWLQIQNSFEKSLQLGWFKNNNGTQDYRNYLPRLLRRFQHLEAICLGGCCKLPDQALSELQHFGSAVRFLSLDCCFGITDNGLSFVSTGCPTLMSISLYRSNITDTGLEIFANSCRGLEKINISYCGNLSDRGIRALSQYSFKLKVLTISYCRHINGTGLSGCSSTLAFLEADCSLLTREGLLAAVSGGGLEYLNVSSLRNWAGGDGLDGIGSGFAMRLRLLNLRLCRFVGDESVTAIAKGCPLLEEWNLGLCHEVRVCGWQAIGVYCRNLRILHVNRCRNLCDNGLQAIRDGCGRLVVLHIHGCRSISSIGLESFRRLRWGVRLSEEECPCIGPSFNFMENWHPMLPPVGC